MILVERKKKDEGLKSKRHSAGRLIRAKVFRAP